MPQSTDLKQGRAASVASLALERIVRSPAALVENLPIGIYTCDPGGTIVQHNRRAAELWGRTPAASDSAIRFCGAFKLRDTDGKQVPPGESPMAQVLRGGEAVRDRELTLEDEAGRRRTILANADPILDERGRLVGGITCIQDITELVVMRRQMVEGRKTLRGMMETLPAAIYTTDAEGRLLFFNKAAVALWGLTPELGERKWCGAWKLFTADGEPVAPGECPMATAIRERRALIGPEMIAEHPDGTRVPFLPHPTPMFDGEGNIVGALNMMIDLTEQKRAGAQQRGMIDELNHRVKNTLATIQSLAAQTMRNSSSPGTQQFEQRLLALSRVHDQLSRHSWEWADFADIAGEIFAPLRGSADARVHRSGPSLRLPPKSALALAMVLYELAANAKQHGALSSPAGSLTLSWYVEDRRLAIDWREAGGPAVTSPSKRGFGTRLLDRSITGELGGTMKLDHAPAGVHCTMEIPLA